MRSFLGSIAVAGLALAGCASHHVSMSDVPPNVRDTINREAGGAAITKVEKETKNGQTYYEADTMKNGKKWEIKVDESGRVISSGEEHD